MTFSACQPAKTWTTIGELTGSDGGRYIVRQMHYDWVEGWQVSFGYVDNTGENFRYYLSHESSRWGKVSLVETNGTVKVFQASGEHAASFWPSNGLFINHLNKTTYSRESGRVNAQPPESFFLE
jgi:hypothetical protein